MGFFLNIKPILIGILFAFVLNNRANGAVVFNEDIPSEDFLSEEAPILNVAIIGAGVSGLASAKNALAQGYNVTIYEQAEEFGGIWWYTNKTGKDKYGIHIHTPMYQGLRTNLPYQLMEFPEHPYPKDTISFPPQAQVFKYLNSYADRFDLKKYIKLSQLVIRILPIENDKWEIIVKDLPSNTFNTLIYDVVFVCNGHFATPRYPNIPGTNDYKGKIIHSHDFRTAKAFRGQSVLIIGAGASGIDLVGQLAKTANRITFSQRKRVNETKEVRDKRQGLFPRNTILKDEVKRFTPTGAEFIDGTHQTFSVVLLATGYNYTYSFLSVDTGMTVDDNAVTPLYKQVFNIEHPTMVFIGVPFAACSNRVYDLQARFALKFISGEKKLPSKEEMLEDMHTQMQNHYSKGYKKHKTHYLGPEQKEYYNQLAETADIENIPDVMSVMHRDSSLGLVNSPSQFRKYKYTIIDDNTFIKEQYEN